MAAPSRAKQWPKEANAIRIEAVRRGRAAISVLHSARREMAHGNHLIALSGVADAEHYLLLIVSELERAGYALRADVEEE